MGRCLCQVFVWTGWFSCWLWLRTVCFQCTEGLLCLSLSFSLRPCTCTWRRLISACFQTQNPGRSGIMRWISLGKHTCNCIAKTLADEAFMKKSERKSLSVCGFIGCVLIWYSMIRIKTDNSGVFNFLFTFNLSQTGTIIQTEDSR